MAVVAKETMKAVVMHEFGGADVLKYENVEKPVAGPGEAIVEVHAVSVNRTLDLTLRAGDYVKEVTLPHIPGVDPSGIVVEAGEGVDDPRVGDRVFVAPWRERPGTPSISVGVQLPGGYAQYVKAPAHAIAPIPDDLDYVAATVAGRHLGAAILSLRDTARVKPGEWILIMGASGGLGSAGVQVGKHLGARVICAAGSDDRVDAAVALGADAGVNYRAEELTKRVRELTGGKGVDVVFENIGDPDLFPRAFRSLGREGRLVTSGAHGGGVVDLDVEHLFRNRIMIKGVLGSSRDSIAAALAQAPEMDFKPLIDRILPLAEAAQAHRLVGERVVSGKVILDPWAEP